MRIVPPVLLTVLAAAAPHAAAQTNPVAPVPDEPKPGDVDEVEDVVDDDEVLPPRVKDEQTPAGKQRVDAIGRMQADELRESDEERRAKYAYGVALTLGMAHPWQSYSVEADYLARPSLATGLFAGSGAYTRSGIVDEKSYDMRIRTHGMGVSARYFFERLEGLSLEAVLGYASWSGNVSPHGSDDDEPDESEKLTATYDASGVFVGLSAALAWYWDNGVYVNWTLVGVQKSRVLSSEVSREGPAEDALTRDIERGAFFGLTNLSVGYLF